MNTIAKILKLLFVYSNVTTAGNNQLILSNTTSNGTNRSFLDFSEFNDAELASYRLRCGVWITFVLATGFVAAAKFYFSDRVSWSWNFLWSKRFNFISLLLILNIFSTGSRYRNIRILGSINIIIICMLILYFMLSTSSQ